MKTLFKVVETTLKMYIWTQHVELVGCRGPRLWTQPIKLVGHYIIYVKDQNINLVIPLIYIKGEIFCN
jgi:hypothetical protein